LFHDDDTQPFDLGDKTLNCGRRQDSFKAWLSWKVHGTKGFADRVDTCFANTLRFVELLKAKPEAFEVLFEPEFCQVCFLYVMLLVDLLYPSLSLSLFLVVDSLSCSTAASLRRFDTCQRARSEMHSVARLFE